MVNSRVILILIYLVSQKGFGKVACTSLAAGRGDKQPFQTHLINWDTMHQFSELDKACYGDIHAEMGYRVGPRLRELGPRGEREPGGVIHVT